MKNSDLFQKLFPEPKPIIGMIHLAGSSGDKRIKRALEELTLYQEEGVDGAIVEDYHGSSEDVYEALKQSYSLNLNIVRGVNILSRPPSSFELAQEFGAKFVQLDTVQTRDLIPEEYEKIRKEYPNIAVLGGVGFKYIGSTGNPLEVDLEEGMSRCEAIVTTGSGTGIETPIEKLREYKRILGNFPLIVGAGVDPDNAYEQLRVADGAIIGSYFKPRKNTQLPIDRKRVRALMFVVKEIRKEGVKA